jgi:hypothetical protein
MNGVVMRVISVIAALLVIASAAHACDADECASLAGLSCPKMQISVCPGGDFEMIRHGCDGIGDYIWVEIYAGVGGCYGDPIPGIPTTDFWIGACDPSQALCFCTAPIVADSLTGMNGRTTFSGVLSAGGCVPGGGIWIMCQGHVIRAKPCPNMNPLCLNIVIKSPDINGAGGKPDCVVNLSDLVPFGYSYNTSMGRPGFNACCDYNDDNQCNLSDFAYFGTHYQHRCS